MPAMPIFHLLTALTTTFLLNTTLTEERKPSTLRNEVGRAVHAYRVTGQAPILERSDTTLFPFGESQPVIPCSPLRACDIELQAGEIVTGVALGDTERWVTSPLESGSPDEPTPHVLVKPKDYDLTTNLIIGTDRRTYHLTLVSPSKEELGDGAPYVRRAAFYYPQDFVQLWQVDQDRRRRAAAKRASLVEEELSGASLTQLDFSYAVGRKGDVTWFPETVFDDGEHVYIRLPQAVRNADLPSLLVEIDGGGMALANYRVKDQWFIVDGLFDRADLTAGVGKKRKVVSIHYRGDRGER